MSLQLVEANDSVLTAIQNANGLIQRNTPIEAISELEKVLGDCDHSGRETHLQVVEMLVQLCSEIAAEQRLALGERP